MRAGHIIVPVGLTNAHHEPINFFGVYRPEGESTILPSTWHENGLEIFGSFGKGYTGFDYQAMIVAGLNANGFDRNTWVAGGKQGLFEVDNFTSPGYAFRLDNKGVPGLRVGGSFYYCADAGSNSDKLQDYSTFKVQMCIRERQCREIVNDSSGASGRNEYLYTFGFGGSQSFNRRNRYFMGFEAYQSAINVKKQGFYHKCLFNYLCAKVLKKRRYFVLLQANK